jgi:hypothetical protein
MRTFAYALRDAIPSTQLFSKTVRMCYAPNQVCFVLAIALLMDQAAQQHSMSACFNGRSA